MGQNESVPGRPDLNSQPHWPQPPFPPIRPNGQPRAARPAPPAPPVHQPFVNYEMSPRPIGVVAQPPVVTRNDIDGGLEAAEKDANARAPPAPLARVKKEVEDKEGKNRGKAGTEDKLTAVQTGKVHKKSPLQKGTKKKGKEENKEARRAAPKRVWKEEPVAVAESPEMAALDVTVKAERSNSSNSNKSEKPKKKNHGSWEYVPAEPRVYYPKVTRVSNGMGGELARLAMDVVDSQHDLTKPPQEWYVGSEFDMDRPISMADRIKLNQRIRESRRAESAESKEKAKPARKVTKAKRTEKRPKMDGITPDPTSFECRVRPDSESSNGSEELGTPFDELMVDIRRSASLASLSASESSLLLDAPLLESPLLESSLMDAPLPESPLMDSPLLEDAPILEMPSPVRVMSAHTTYSAPQASPFPDEFPEDFLEEEAAAHDGNPGAPSF